MSTIYYDDLVLTAEKDVHSRNFCTLVDAAVSLFEEEERLRVGCVADNYDTRVFCLLPRKKRSFVSRTRINPPNPNLLGGEASTSSSSLFLLDLNTIPPEKKNPRNLNSRCVTEKASRKRRAGKEIKPKGGSKKAKAGPVLSWRGRDVPDSILRIMRTMNVTEQEPKLIFEKPILYTTDVHPHQSRLSMPINQVIRNDFVWSLYIELL